MKAFIFKIPEIICCENHEKNVMKFVIAVTPFLLLSPPAWSAEFFVAAGGDDGHPGTVGQPFATLERARDAIRASGLAGKETCTVWLGAVDELWKMGKTVGHGGPWKDRSAKAGVPSDPYLMTGYYEKSLILLHKSDEDVIISVEVDITCYGD